MISTMVIIHNQPRFPSKKCYFEQNNTRNLCLSHQNPSFICIGRFLKAPARLRRAACLVWVPLQRFGPEGLTHLRCAAALFQAQHCVVIQDTLEVHGETAETWCQLLSASPNPLDPRIWKIFRFFLLQLLIKMQTVKKHGFTSWGHVASVPTCHNTCFSN